MKRLLTALSLAGAFAGSQAADIPPDIVDVGFDGAIAIGTDVVKTRAAFDADKGSIILGVSVADQAMKLEVKCFAAANIMKDPENAEAAKALKEAFQYLVGTSHIPFAVPTEKMGDPQIGRDVIKAVTEKVTSDAIADIIRTVPRCFN